MASRDYRTASLLRHGSSVRGHFGENGRSGLCAKLQRAVGPERDRPKRDAAAILAAIPAEVGGASIPTTGYCAAANRSRFPECQSRSMAGGVFKNVFAIRAYTRETARSVASDLPGPLAASRSLSAIVQIAACRPRCLAGSVWVLHLEAARAGSIVPSGRVVVRPVAIALRAAASETPRWAAYSPEHANSD